MRALYLLLALAFALAFPFAAAFPLAFAAACGGIVMRSALSGVQMLQEGFESEDDTTEADE